MPRSSRVAPDWIERVKLAVRRNGFLRQQDLAQELGMARYTISKFLNGEPVDHLCFVEISEKLGLDWLKIVDLEDDLPTEVLVELLSNAATFEKIQ
ncbi:hypothetical protein ACE1CI_01615 [Aerosakkonemataceae cyanobacterium BLCC-F50]|uniref:HTH cro/C1-type domain-containing protein n=1 Tax=Floridaenema flaviceps BLCC-F50 TaxID=3153642 RepID=A0ABV4XKX0_9CYAN